MLLAYRTPADSVAHLVPAGLELITHGGWAFWNVVACRLEAMRPSGCPRWIGRDCRQVAYRLYVRAHVAEGEVLEGLCFVRTDVDSRAMCLLGNQLTDFRFHRTAIRLSADSAGLSVMVSDPVSVGDAEIMARCGESTLAPDSCFESYAQACRFLKYQPLALSTDRDGLRVRLAEVLRCETDWCESPLEVIDARFAFFEHLGQDEIRLELATRVAPIEYCWRLGASRPSARYDARG